MIQLLGHAHRLDPRAAGRVLALAAILAAGAFPQGCVIVGSDEWPLSDAGFAQAPESTSVLARDLGVRLANGGAGNFLVCSSNFGLTGSTLAGVMTAAGHSWTVATSVPTTLAELMSYQAVFLCGAMMPDPALLTQFVQNWRNVYIAAGSGEFGTAAAEAAAWAPFLSYFGLALAPAYNNLVQAVVPVTMAYPPFQDAPSLYFWGGQDVQIVAGPYGSGVVIDPQGLFGVFDLYPISPWYQTNRPAAALDIDGNHGGVYHAAAPGGFSGALAASGPSVGLPWDIAFTSPQPGLASWIQLSDGQILNLALGLPSANLGFLFGGFTQPFPGPFAVPYSLAAGAPLIALQMIGADPTAPLGFSLSQLATIDPAVTP